MTQRVEPFGSVTAENTDILSAPVRTSVSYHIAHTSHTYTPPPLNLEPLSQRSPPSQAAHTHEDSVRMTGLALTRIRKPESDPAALLCAHPGGSHLVIVEISLLSFGLGCSIFFQFTREPGRTQELHR